MIQLLFIVIKILFLIFNQNASLLYILYTCAFLKLNYIFN